MKIMILLLCCIGSMLADSQADSTELSNKLTSTKSSLNTIPSGSGQKSSLLHQPNGIQSQQQLQQPQHQYIPQYVVPKPSPPAAMFIIAPQPSPSHHQGGHQNSPLFQQAVQQLLSYYSNNPQAKYQLLQQQGGLPSHAQIPQQHQLPSGALHVIPSPQLESSNAPAQNHPSGPPQATYVIPAQSLQSLSSFHPGLLAQLTGQSTQSQPVPMQFSPHQIVSQTFQPQFNGQHFVSQQIPQFVQQIPSSQFNIPQQYNIPAQFSQGQFHQGQVLKQSIPQSEYSTQTEKSQLSSSSSNYNPVFRTAYVKG